MRMVAVQEAVGMVLCHDVTKIVPGVFKGRAFKKGHIISPQDVPELLKLGKDNIYVWDKQEGTVHENEAALRLGKAAAGDGVELTEPNQGRVNLKAARRGLLKVNVEALAGVNALDQLMMATRHNNYLVEQGDLLAGTKVIPLVIEEEKIQEAERICDEAGGLVQVKEIRPKRVGMVTTGNEVFYGRIRDGFGPVVKEKMALYQSEVMEQVLVPDDRDMIAEALQSLVNKGAELIITTGGMAVDPDDVTPAGVRRAGAEIVSYGTPLLPGAMFMVAYLGDIPVLGLPGCVMFAKTTVLDVLLPRVFAGERIERKDLAVMGHGGLCLECEVCRYPLCSFGRGI